MRRKNARLMRAVRHVSLLSAAALLAGFVSQARAQTASPVIVDNVDGNIPSTPTQFPNSSNVTINKGQLLTGTPLIVGDVSTGVVDVETNGFNFVNNVAELGNGLLTGPNYDGPASGPSAIIGNHANSSGTVNMGINGGFAIWDAVGDIDIADQRMSTGAVNIGIGYLNILDGDINVGGTSSGPGGTATINLENSISGINVGFTANQFTGAGTNLRLWTGGTVNLTGGGTINIGNIVNDGGTFNWTQGTVQIISDDVDMGSAGDIFTSSFALNNGMSLQVDQTLTINGFTLNVAGSLNAGQLIVSNGGLINFTNGNLTIQNGGINSNQIINNSGLSPVGGIIPASGPVGNDFSLNSGQTLTLGNNGQLTIEPGDMFTVNGGSLVVGSIPGASGGFVFDSGSVALTDPTFGVIIDPNDGNFFPTANVTINPGASFSFAGSLTVGDTGQASLEVDSNSGITTSGYGLITGSATIGNQSHAVGSLMIGNSSQGYTGGYLVQGNLNVGVSGSGAVVVDQGELTVQGDINLGSASGGTGSLTINPGGTVNGLNQSTTGNLNIFTGSTLNLDGGQLYTGHLNDLGGTFNFNSGTLTVTQNLDIASPSDLIGPNFNLQSGDFLNVGGNTNVDSNNFNITGGNLVTGTLSNSNGGLINFNSGLLQVENGGISTSQVINTDGSGIILAGGNIRAAGAPVGNNLYINYNQTLTLNNNGILAIQPSDTVTLNGGALTAGSITNATTNFFFDSGVLDLTDPTVGIIIDPSDGNFFPTANVTINSNQGLSIAGSLTVGDLGTASLQVDTNSGAEFGNGLATGTATIGNQHGSNGTLTIGDFNNGFTGSYLIIGDLNIAAQAGSTGNVIVDQGELTVDASINIGAGAGGTATLTVNPNGTVNANNTENNNNLTLYPGGIVNLDGGKIYTGFLTESGGTFNAFSGNGNVSGTLQVTDGDVGIGAAGDVFPNGVQLIGGDALDVIAGTTALHSGTVLQIYGGAFVTGSISFANPGTGSIDFQQGVFSVADGAPFDITNLQNGADLSNGFNLDVGQYMSLYSNAVMQIPAGKSFQVNGGVLVTGSISDPGGGFRLNSGALILQDPTFGVTFDTGGLLKSTDFPDGHELFIDNNVTFLSIAGPLTVGDTHVGVLNVYNSGFILGTEAPNAGLVSGPSTVGNQAGSNGSVFVGFSAQNTPGLWVVNGDANIAAQAGSTGQVVVDYGDWTVQGDINVGGTTAAAGGTGSLFVNANGTVNANYQGSNTNALRVYPGGSVVMNGGTLNVGTLDGQGGTLFFNSGTINVAQNLDVANPADLLGPFYTLVNGDYLNVAGNTNVDGNNQALPFVVNGGSFTTNTLSTSNEGFIDFDSQSGNGGTVIVNSGGFNIYPFYNATDQSSNMSLDAGMTLRALNNGVVTVPNNFTFAINGGLFEAGSIVDGNTDDLHGFRFNSGSLQLDDPGVTVEINGDGLLKSAYSPDGSHVLLTYNKAYNLNIAGPVIVGDTTAGDLNVQTGSNYYDNRRGATTGALTVGKNGGTGTVEVGDPTSGNFGNLTTRDDALVGADAGSTGIVTVNYGVWIINGKLDLGGTNGVSGGTASLTVGPSGTVSVNNGNNLSLYDNSVVNLNGGRIYVGGTLDYFGSHAFNFNSGTLEIGGDLHVGVATDVFKVGPTLNAGSTLQVDGNTIVESTNLQVYGGTFQTNTIAFQAGGLIDFTQGSVTIENGGLNSANIFNSADHSANFVLNTGQSLTLNNNGVLTIPHGTTFYENGGSLVAGSISDPPPDFEFNGGSLQLTDGTVTSYIDSLDGTIPSADSPTGASLNMNGIRTNLTLAGPLIIGDSGTGSLTIGGGVAYAQVLNADATIGNQPGSTGSVLVGSNVNNVEGYWQNANLTVGNAGNGSLDIQANGQVVAFGNLLLGGQPGGSGTVNVESGGSLTVDGTTTVNNGSLTIGGGANVGAITIGAQGSVTENGPNANLNTPSIDNGNGGAFSFIEGSLSLTNSNLTVGPGGLLGTDLDLMYLRSVYISGQTDVIPGGTLNIEGGSLDTGTFADTGSVSFTAGSLTIRSGDLIIDNGGPFGATFAINGNASLNIGDNIIVGNTNSGEFDVNDGVVSSGGGIIASQAGSTGTANVGSPLTSGNWDVTNLTVGGAGAGTLNINNGNVTAFDSVTLGASPGGSGQVSVTNGYLQVYDALTISNGGIQVGDNGAVYSGSAALVAGNTVTINGNGALFDAAYLYSDPTGSVALTQGKLEIGQGNLAIGTGANRPLGNSPTLAAGQALQIDNGQLQLDHGSTITLSGGSLTTPSIQDADAANVHFNSGQLYLSQSGLTISPSNPLGGNVFVPSGSQITVQSLNIGDSQSGGMLINGAVVIPAGDTYLAPGAGGALADVNGLFSTGYHLVVGGSFNSVTGMPVQGGNANLRSETNSQVSANDIHVMSGSRITADGLVSANNVLNILNGASLIGTGTVAANVITLDGTVAPGDDSAAPLTIDGTFNENNDSTSVFSINTSAAGRYSQLVLNQNDTLNGTLELFPFNIHSSFGQVYDIVTDSGTLTGTFSNAVEGQVFTVGGRKLKLDYEPNDVSLTDITPGALITLTGTSAPTDNTFVDLAANLPGDQVLMGPGNGNYVPVLLHPATPAVKSYFAYSGFTQGDTIDVLLKFNNLANGSDPTVDPQVLADIEAFIMANQTGGPITIGPVTAGLAYGFPGTSFDLTLSVTAGPNDPFASFDFSNFSDSTVPAGDLALSDVGIVPEPAAVGMLTLAGGALLARRRRRKA